VLIALYTTAAVCELPVSLGALALTAATAATLSALTVDAPGRQTSATSGAIIAAGLTIGIWALGAYVQTRRRYLRELQERAAFVEREREQLSRIAVHEERASIARELHDIVAHSGERDAGRRARCPRRATHLTRRRRRHASAGGDR
jgi:signal transduction histidine kinase